MKTPGEALAQRIRAEFPDLQWNAYRYIDTGMDHQVIVLDERWVFRIPRNHPDDLENEIQLLNYLSGRVRAGIPVYQYASADQCLAGYPFLPGVELSRSLFFGMSPAMRTVVGDRLADLLTDFHSVPPSDVARFNVPKGERPSLDLHASLDLLSSVFGRAAAAAVSGFVHKFNATFAHDGPQVFLHGELNAEHILWDPTPAKISTIDVSACFIGDPAHDFSELWKYGEDLVRQVIQRYEGPKYPGLADRAALLYKAMPIGALAYWVSAGKEIPPKTVALFEDRWPEIS